MINRNHFRPAGDSTINGINYNILTQTPSSQNGPVTTFGAEEITGFYRNDSANKKVFFLPKDSTVEELFYDFDLSVGDTLPQTYFMRIKGNGETFIVDTIGDTTFADGVLRKTYKYSCPSCFAQENILVEGIGSLTGLTSSFIGSGLAGNERLSCYRNNSVLVYSVGSCPNLPVSLQEKQIEKKALKLYPNPSNGEFIISFKELEQKLDMIQVRTVNGKAINFEIQRMSEAQFKLRLPQQPGIYFLIVGRFTEKVIVQ